MASQYFNLTCAITCLHLCSKTNPAKEMKSSAPLVCHHGSDPSSNEVDETTLAFGAHGCHNVGVGERLSAMKFTKQALLVPSPGRAVRQWASRGKGFPLQPLRSRTLGHPALETSTKTTCHAFSSWLPARVVSCGLCWKKLLPLFTVHVSARRRLGPLRNNAEFLA